MNCLCSYYLAVRIWSLLHITFLVFGRLFPDHVVMLCASLLHWVCWESVRGDLSNDLFCTHFCLQHGCTDITHESVLTKLLVGVHHCITSDATGILLLQPLSTYHSFLCDVCTPCIWLYVASKRHCRKVCLAMSVFLCRRTCIHQTLNALQLHFHVCQRLSLLA